MRTNDFTAPITSRALNESMFKKFGVKVNFDKYDREQLENYRNLLRTKIHQEELSSNFNALLSNESYQKDKFMMDLLTTRIKEMLGEGKKAKPDFLDKDKDGNKKEPFKKAIKDKEKKVAEAKGKKPDFLDMDKDGNKKEPMKKAVADKKKGAVKEGKAHSHEMAHRYAIEYAKAVKEGNLDYAIEMRDACESWGGKISHGAMGEAFHTHLGINKGQTYKCDEGNIGAGIGGAVGGAIGSAVGGPIGGIAGSALGGMAGDKITGESRNVKEAKKLSPKQKKVMDKDSDGDIDAKDLKKLRKENMVRKQKAGITESIARFIAEDEEGKAKSITAGLDMVNDFTSWMQRIATYQTKSMIELSDQIRAHFGDAEAQRFKEETYNALEQSLSALTQSREQLSQSVAVLAGEAPAQEPMGAEPGMDAGMDAGMEDPEALPAPEGDEFGAADAAAGGPETTGRMKRESVERGNRLMKILGA